jgi:hypothetical protein
MGWPFGAARGGGQAKEPSQRTAPSALVAAVLIIAAVILGAHACSDRWTAEPPMERYVRLGPRLGAAELERDLLRDHPPGSGIGPLFARLARLGFDCRMASEAGRGGECRFRARREDGLIATLLVAVAHDGVEVGGIAGRMAVGPP